MPGMLKDSECHASHQHCRARVDAALVYLPVVDSIFSPTTKPQAGVVRAMNYSFYGEHYRLVLGMTMSVLIVRLSFRLYLKPRQSFTTLSRALPLYHEYSSLRYSFGTSLRFIMESTRLCSGWSSSCFVSQHIVVRFLRICLQNQGKRGIYSDV